MVLLLKWRKDVFILQKCLLLVWLLQQTQIPVLFSLNLGLLGRAGPSLSNEAEMVCRIFPFRDQEAVGVFGCFYFLSECKPNLRALTAPSTQGCAGWRCVSWLWQGSRVAASVCDWTHSAVSIYILRPRTTHEPKIAFSGSSAELGKHLSLEEVAQGPPLPGP